VSRASVLARGRAAAQAGMIDTCLIQRQTGSTTNPETGVVTPTWSTIYNGVCRMQEHGGYPRDITVAPDQPQLAVNRELQLPVSSSGAVRAGDRVTITACVNDASMVNRQMWLRGQPSKSEATARRFTLEEIAG
jgi:hypothetical protein